eukprot:5265377-Prymnesium_polylepis.1
MSNAATRTERAPHPLCFARTVAALRAPLGARGGPDTRRRRAGRAIERRRGPRGRRAAGGPRDRHRGPAAAHGVRARARADPARRVGAALHRNLHWRVAFGDARHSRLLPRHLPRRTAGAGRAAAAVLPSLRAVLPSLRAVLPSLRAVLPSLRAVLPSLRA